MITVVTLSGPTGAGKTAAALALAEALPVSVINADSRQVYADFPIITAQPSPEEQARCPHHLYGWLPTDEAMGVGRYAECAAPVIRDVHETDGLPLLVGGTGLYLKTLLEGVAPIPAVDKNIRHRLQDMWKAEGPLAMHARLAAVDPEYAAKIHPNDRQRTTRALEVWEATNKPFSWWHARPLPPSPYRVIKIGIRKSLAELEPILKRRIGIMMETGALDEARRALDKCPDGNAPGWSGIGCRELYDHLAGNRGLEECLDLWYRNTRAYAKRQITWFRPEKDIHWFAPEDTKAIVSTVTGLLSRIADARR